MLDQNNEPVAVREVAPTPKCANCGKVGKYAYPPIHSSLEDFDACGFFVVSGTVTESAAEAYERGQREMQKLCSWHDHRCLHISIAPYEAPHEK